MYTADLLDLDIQYTLLYLHYNVQYSMLYVSEGGKIMSFSIANEQPSLRPNICVVFFFFLEGNICVVF
ncbi:hypothetical protein BDA96_01G488600 [Sorghum bicolor]|uniref:Uncharacterized protein n=1 Tax=Sorghum bicolor TaxID=4558 RepID=A0A921S641_SORBI|nr:hypothetical protein BDA96_01G488600 [Sorghum bicolor]